MGLVASRYSTTSISISVFKITQFNLILFGYWFIYQFFSFIVRWSRLIWMIFGLLTISLLLEIPSWQSLSGSSIKTSALYLLLLFSTHKFNSSFPVLNYRKVLRQMASGSRDAERVKLKLEIKVEVYLFLIFFFSLFFFCAYWTHNTY